ncbi:C10 family peptidase [Flavobacterium sp. M31R6]|uniref:C10 family peptidase n=1 Tax=Flavobacterium sp. M31R6 TaxID=2739062 RepID=UPI0015689781|nr:C10 family peptidase [Flavobacterium sp. M31R6]QKJ63035.1 C10 family peptidase [Flavobacterium sp. M31R6]
MTKSLFLFFLSFILLISCDKQEDESVLQPNSSTVNQKIVNEIAQSFFKKENTTAKGVNNNKTIENIIIHKTAKNENAFYVINYKEGGFLIISADNRISPILAFSDTGSFSSIPTEIIPPVQYWMKGEKEQVQNVIDHQLTQSKEVKQEWKVLADNNSLVKSTSSTSRIEPDPINYCPDATVQKGPFLTTIWGQGNGYNNLLDTNCSYTDYFGYKAPTGCVATAIAQVMRYFHKANTYNWANMPNYGRYANGTSDTQQLMKDIGFWVKMRYYCDTSWAYSEDIVPTLIYHFGYSNANFADFNLNTVVQNLNSNKPVILSGGTNSGGSYTNGHAWVCDGYTQSTFYSRDDYGNCTGQAVTYSPLLHMNWGWDNDYNAYYSVSHFNTGTSSYNYKNTMVYNITP